MSEQKRASFERDWTSILDHLSLSIMDKFVESRDVIRFGAACKLWNSSMKFYLDMKKKHKAPVPMMLFKSTESTGELYCVVDNKFINGTVSIPFGSGELCGSGYGWLAFMDENNVITLFQPFKDRNTIKLPPLPTPFRRNVKVILSADPSEDCIVVAMLRGRNELAYTRLGQESWALMRSRAWSDVVFYEGLVYAITFHGALVRIDLRHPNPVVNILDHVATFHASRFRLVQSLKGDLILIARLMSSQVFKVYKLLIDEETLIIRKVKMNNLGGETLFVSRGGQSLCASHSMEFASDSIYEVYDHNFYTRREFNVYNVADRTVTSFMPRKSWAHYPSPIVWFVPPFEFHSHNRG